MSDLAPAAIGAEEARERLDRVKVNISAAAEDMTALYQGRAWVTLGFDSWDDLCDHELGGVRIALPRDQRREVVGQMRDAEMSAPAIGTALGVTHTTIRNDLKELSGSGRTFPDTVIGIDGRRRPAHVTTTTRTTETTEVEQDVDLDTGEIIERPTPVTLPPIPRDHERERLVAQMTRLVRAITDLDGLPDPVARARYAREWDPSLSDANPSNATPDHMRATASGLLAFADELEATRELRVV